MSEESQRTQDTSLQEFTEDSTQNSEDAPAELSEVDLGNKDQVDFDESITFSHSYNNYRIVRCLPTKKQLQEATFDLLLSNEFLLSGTIKIDEANLMSNSEFAKNVKEKAKKFNGEDLKSKVNFMENIPFYVEEIGFEQTVDLLLPIILKISKEKETVIEAFLRIFPQFVDLLAKFGDEGYKILKDHITKVLEELFKSKKDNILQLCSNDLVYITKFIKEEDKGMSILTIVIFMAHNDEDEDSRVLSVKLFNDLALIIGQELCQLYVVPQVASFADDQSCKVRKAVAGNFINICQAVSKECFNDRLLKVYQKLSVDSLWTVRKASAEILPKLTKLCEPKIVSTVLLDIFQKFASDQKNFVRFSALEVFGEFISLLNKDEIKNYGALLDFYITTINEFTLNNSKKEDISIIVKCAFNFPAVLLFYGKESWDKLRPCFSKMAEEKDEKVKIPLAAALGEISKILGPEITEKDIVPYVDKFYKSSKELQMRILDALPDIIRNITSNQKNVYLDHIKIMINTGEKWRKRLLFSTIIGKFNNTYPDQIIYKRVFPIAMNFCFDDVSQVRMNAARSNSKMLLQLLSSETEYSKKAYTIVKSFAESVNYNYRQLFILMCLDLFENEKLYKEKIACLLLNLAYDKICNVKITLGKFIKEVFETVVPKFEWVKSDETIRKIVKLLKKNPEPEIQVSLANINVEDIDVEETKEVNSLFVDKMTFISNEFGITKNVPIKSETKIRAPSTQTPTEKIESTTPTPTPTQNEEESKETKQEEEKKEEPKQEETKQEETKQEETKQEETKQEETKQEETKQEETKQEETKQGEIKQEETKQEETKQEETKQEETKNEETKQEEKKEEENKEEEKKEGN